MSGDPVIREYRRTASDYDRRWADYTERTLSATLARLPTEPGQRLLDVGCGTGVLLARIHHRHPEVSLAGADPVAEMLAAAQQRLPAGTPLLQARAQRLAFSDTSFDCIVSSNTFHFVREPETAVREFWRVLVPGGRLVLSDWCADYFSMRLLDWRLRLLDAAHFRTWTGEGLATLLRANGFADVRVDRYRIDWRWGMMCALATRREARESHE